MREAVPEVWTRTSSKTESAEVLRQKLAKFNTQFPFSVNNGD